MKFLELKMFHVISNKLDLIGNTSCKTNEMSRFKILHVRHNNIYPIGNTSCKKNEITRIEYTSCKVK